MSLDSNVMDDITIDKYDELEELAGGDEKLQEMLQKLLESTKQEAAKPQQLMNIHYSVYILAFTVIFGLLGNI